MTVSSEQVLAASDAASSPVALMSSASSESEQNIVEVRDFM